MKKLNRKGFTLVELLAVIIILAIVVGITVPAITTTINNSKNNALGVAVDAAEDYLADEYALMSVDYNSASKAFTNLITGPVTAAEFTYDQSDKKLTTIKINGTSISNGSDKGIALLKEMGFSLDNIKTVKFTIDANGVACVTVTAIPTTSEYYSTQYWKTTGAAAGTTTKNYSKSCKAALS